MCSIPEQLAAKKFQADTCEIPVRSEAASTKSTVWALFAIASLFAIFRFANRCPQLGGAGYWWDDYTLWLCCIPMIVLAVLVDVALRHGLGQDVWEVSVPDILLTLKVSSHLHAVKHSIQSETDWPTIAAFLDMRTSVHRRHFRNQDLLPTTIPTHLEGQSDVSKSVLGCHRNHIRGVYCIRVCNHLPVLANQL